MVNSEEGGIYSPKYKRTILWEPKEMKLRDGIYGKTKESIEGEKKFWADLQREFMKLERQRKWVHRIGFGGMLLGIIVIVIATIIERG